MSSFGATSLDVPMETLPIGNVAGENIIDLYGCEVC